MCGELAGGDGSTCSWLSLPSLGTWGGEILALPLGSVSKLCGVTCWKCLTLGATWAPRRGEGRPSYLGSLKTGPREQPRAAWDLLPCSKEPAVCPRGGHALGCTGENSHQPASCLGFPVEAEGYRVLQLRPNEDPGYGGGTPDLGMSGSTGYFSPVLPVTGAGIT